MYELTKRNETTAKQEGAVATRKAELATTPAVSTLAKAVRQKAETARKTMEKAAEAACTLESVKKALSQETQLVVDIGESAKRAYDESLIKFDTNKAGEMFAQLKDAGGRYGKKIPIKEKIVSQGLNPLEVQNAMRTQAIQEQLEQIVATLQEISEGVSEIKQGQHDDRLGLFLSGRALYLEACEISDQTMKKLLEAQALKSLSDANGQLSQSLSTDIKYLIEGKYKSRKTGQKAAIEERIASIRSALDTVNMSYALKAASTTATMRQGPCSNASSSMLALSAKQLPRKARSWQSSTRLNTCREADSGPRRHKLSRRSAISGACSQNPKKTWRFLL